MGSLCFPMLPLWFLFLHSSIYRIPSNHLNHPKKSVSTPLGTCKQPPTTVTLAQKKSHLDLGLSVSVDSVGFFRRWSTIWLALWVDPFVNMDHGNSLPIAKRPRVGFVGPQKTTVDGMIWDDGMGWVRPKTTGWAGFYGFLFGNCHGRI